MLRSGPLGGDAQVAAMVADGGVDVLVFFWDPLAVQPHEPDVRSLIRIAVLHDIAIACDRRTADLVITSPLLRATGDAAASGLGAAATKAAGVPGGILLA